MPSLVNFAREYASYIQRHFDLPTATTEIANRIQDLRYASNDAPLSDEDIDKIVNEIARLLSAKKISSDGKHMLLEAEDSSKFIQMVEAIRAKAKKRK